MAKSAQSLPIIPLPPICVPFDIVLIRISLFLLLALNRLMLPFCLLAFADRSPEEAAVRVLDTPLMAALYCFALTLSLTFLLFVRNHANHDAIISLHSTKLNIKAMESLSNQNEISRPTQRAR